MHKLESKIESILLFKNEPVSVKELAKLLDAKVEEVKEALANLTEEYKNRGVVIVSDGESVSFGTHPDLSSLIENIQKEELSRELGRAGLETLAIVVYKEPISRREIDHIRGVSSGFTLRTLLIRGLIERADAIPGERSHSYKPTLKLLEYLGVSRKEDLPEYKTAFAKIEEFVNTQEQDKDTEQDG